MRRKPVVAKSIHSPLTAASNGQFPSAETSENCLGPSLEKEAHRTCWGASSHREPQEPSGSHRTSPKGGEEGGRGEHS